MRVALALSMVLVGGVLIYDGFHGLKIWDQVLAKVRPATTATV